MSFQIEKGVGLPEKATRKGGRKSTYPWEALEVGDSFTVPGKMASKFVHTCYSASKRLAPKKFICRDEGIGVRVWRTA